MLEVVLGKALLAVVMWPTWLYLIELIWLFGMWLYYFIRFMTRQRSGPGDDETRRRGAALEGVIAPLSDEAHHTHQRLTGWPGARDRQSLLVSPALFVAEPAPRSE